LMSLLLASGLQLLTQALQEAFHPLFLGPC